MLLAACFFLFGLTVPNFNAMSMEPLGAIAGTAAAFLGTYTTLMGAVLGLLIGRAFDGTITPLSSGVAILGSLCVARRVLGRTRTPVPRLAAGRVRDFRP